MTSKQHSTDRDQHNPLLLGKWVKSTRSALGNDCVECHWDGEHVHVRHSKNPDGPKLSFSRQEWDAFTADVVDGGLAIPRT